MRRSLVEDLHIWQIGVNNMF